MAMERALYGPGGFYVSGDRPYRHFRTSVHAGPLFAGAVAELLLRVDRALGGPPRLDLVDVGAGRGELLVALLSLVPDGVRARLRPVAVEVSPRPAALPAEVDWRADLPERVTGLLLATEWLDNVPLDVVEVDDVGEVRYVLVDGTGQERPGPPVEPADAAWLDSWWPLHGAAPGSRAELGAPRDDAWAGAVRAVERGLALAVDYGHLRAGRPAFGTLTGYRDGRQVRPVPDGSCDLTAHVAIDAVARAPGVPSRLLKQGAALRALGADSGRPPLELAHRDPRGYVAALVRAGAAAELTDPAGLGGHYWLVQPVVIPGVL
jgi:SAM-dependent MidA family methyltransferase